MELPAVWKLFSRLTALLFPVIAVLVLSNLLLNILDDEGKCTTQHLTYMCGLYADRKVQGPLCDAICSEQLTVHRCLSLRPEKQVLHVSWEHRGPQDMSHDQAEVILKFSSQSWYEMVAQPHHLEDTYLNYSYLIEKQAHDICMKEFESNESCHNFGQRTVLYADGDSDGEVSQSEFSNMLSLLMQREFFMLLALNDSESTLDILGYCGGFYAVQKIKYPSSQVFGSEDHIFDVLPTFVLDDISEILSPALGQYGEHAAKYLDRNFRQVRVPGWQERVDFINQTFGILYDFSSQYGTAVRCCDSHLGNYGISDSGRVKYIDMDAVMSTNAALLDLSYRQCQADEDCGVGHYDDCSSMCDEELGRCRDVMKQDDLHNFCTSTMSPVLLDRTVVSDLGVDKKLFKQLSHLVRECERLPLFTTVEEFREKGILYVWNKFHTILREDKTVQ